MSSRPDLHLDWASHEAAKYACLRWHYAGCLPSGKLVRVGVWEDDRYLGVVIFSRGASPHIGDPYGLPQTAVCELTRVALRGHTAPVSRVVSVALRLLKRANPGIRLVVSYSDPLENHHGGIYQAGNWVYVGQTKSGLYFKRADGRRVHNRLYMSDTPRRHRLIASGYLAPEKTPPKHKYLMPLDDEMRAQIEPLRKPYPKRPKQATTGDQPASGGAAPTRTLQSDAP